MRIFMVGTEFLHTGGIQRVNRLLLRAFSEFAQDTPSHIEAFSYLDSANSLPEDCMAGAALRWHACAGRRARLAQRLAQRAWQVQPHVVLFTHASLLRLARFVRWLAPTARIGVLCHGAEVWEPLASGIRSALERAEAVVAPSEYTCRKLVEVHALDADRIAVLPHGLDAEFISLADSAHVSKRKGQTLLSVARLSQDDARYGSKGVDDVLRALPHILQRCPAARYVVVGDGDDRARLETLARELGVTPQVEFRGELSEQEIARAYEEADVFVLPSTLEGFGMVFAEAMAYRLPVVAAHAGAAPEVVEDGVSGILVSPSNVENLAPAVSDLLLQDNERHKMGEAGRRRVEQMFLYSHFAARWKLWLAQLSPEAVYLARHAAVFARPAPTIS